MVDTAYLRLVSDQYLRTVVIAGRPELGMPGFRDYVPGKPMTPDEISDVVAWLAIPPPGPGPRADRKIPGSHRRNATLNLKPVMTPNEPENHPPQKLETKSYSTRRDFLLQVGVILNAIAGFMIGIPILGFIFSSLIKYRPRIWFSLGPVSNFPEGAMRLTVYENPYRREADGETARLTCWVKTDSR